MYSSSCSCPTNFSFGHSPFHYTPFNSSPLPFYPPSQNFFITEADVDEDDEEEEEDEVEEGWEQHKANRENEKGPSARDIENERRLASDLDGVDEEQIEQYYRYYSRTPSIAHFMRLVFVMPFNKVFLFCQYTCR